MSIIGSLPNNLANGTTADASQVMADLNFIVNQVNANASPLGTLSAPTGTRMMFHQAAAPTGWVTDASVSNHAVIVSPANGGAIYSAGTPFINFVNGTWSTGSHALVASEIPAHNHNFALVGGSGIQTGAAQYNGGSILASETTDGGTGGGAGHAHPMSNTWNTATCIIAQKS